MKYIVEPWALERWRPPLTIGSCWSAREQVVGGNWLNRAEESNEPESTAKFKELAF
jgi:hypothetical protein